MSSKNSMTYSGMAVRYFARDDDEEENLNFQESEKRESKIDLSWLDEAIEADIQAL